MNSGSNPKDDLHKAVGHSMERYADVEAQFASLLAALLKIDHHRASIIFFSAAGIRSRLEMIEALLYINLKQELRKPFAPFWNSSAAYFRNLATFRNALAHWHPYYNYYVKESESGPVGFMEPALGAPVFGHQKMTLRTTDIVPFADDCRYACAILQALKNQFKRKPRSLPEKFRKPITRQNQAVLQPPPTIAKAPQPLRKPSVPKLSRADRRKKALREVRESGKKKLM